jgi:hypothetical protein
VYLHLTSLFNILFSHFQSFVGDINPLGITALAGNLEGFKALLPLVLETKECVDLTDNIKYYAFIAFRKEIEDEEGEATGTYKMVKDWKPDDTFPGKKLHLLSSLLFLLFLLLT